MCYWQLRKGGTTVYWYDVSCGRGTAWARQRKMRYICRRKEQKRAFLLCPLIERLKSKQGEYKDICSEMYLGSDTRSPLYCYVQNQHTTGERLSLRSRNLFWICFEGRDSRCWGKWFRGPFSNPLQVKLLESVELLLSLFWLTIQNMILNYSSCLNKLSAWTKVMWNCCN